MWVGFDVADFVVICVGLGLISLTVWSFVWVGLDVADFVVICVGLDMMSLTL